MPEEHRILDPTCKAAFSIDNKLTKLGNTFRNIYSRSTNNETV